MRLQVPSRELGRAGLKVSVLSLGTVSLGIDYGLRAPGRFGCPSKREAARVIQAAADSGINLFDTAPAYGEAERLLGTTLGDRSDCYFATKVLLPPDVMRWSRGDIERHIRQSLEESLRRLRRDTVDVLQIHNATMPLLGRHEVIDALTAAQRHGMVRCLGASVYTEAEATAVLQSGSFDVLQVAYNLLDQRMAKRVFAAAKHAGVSLILRSALLKGALTDKAQWLPSDLGNLRRAVEDLKNRAGGWEELTRLAFRFCLSASEALSVLIGPRTVTELDQALQAVQAGILAPEVLAELTGLNVDDSCLDPADWNVP